MSDQEFSVRELLDHTIDKWWVVVLIAVMGGVVGWASHFLLPPVYESTATITMTMDFFKLSQWEPTQYTQYAEDYAFNSAEYILTSYPVKYQVLDEAKKQGLDIGIDRLNHELFVERRTSNWELHTRDQDPKVATELANIWAEKSLAALDSALEHAYRVDYLEQQLNNIARDPSSANPVQPDLNSAALQNYLNEITQEKKLSAGIVSMMTFALGSDATEPQKPVLYSIAGLVLAGAVIGFVLSLWIVNRFEIRRHDG
jgi:uncharacterized protein involved in exopolysaccharide biosynthesis